MSFYGLPSEAKARQIARVMKTSAAEFTHDRTARAYTELYEKMLKRPLIPKSDSVPAEA
jgi:glycogen synthase